MHRMPVFEEVFKQTRVNFWLIGIPFYSSKISFRFFIFLAILILTALQEVGFFISESSAENFLTLTQLAPCTCVGVLSILKILILVLKKDKVFKLTDCLRNLYNDISKDVEKINHIRQNFIFLGYLTRYYYILNWILISVYNFSTLIIILYHYTETKEVSYILPYAVYLPFSVNIWTTWSAVYLQTIFAGFICVLFYTTVDALYYITSTHISSHFTLISTEIIKLNDKNSLSLNDIVKRHQYILKLSENLEDIFTAVNLFNVLVGTLEICALGFNLTMGKWTETPGVVLFLFSVLLQIFMMSVFGENIIRESRKVGDATFFCKWYLMDHRSQKCILQLIQRVHRRMLIQFAFNAVADGLELSVLCFFLVPVTLRSSKPQTLTAYKFSTISNESFIKIISRSWSYFTILRTIYRAPGNFDT